MFDELLDSDSIDILATDEEVEYYFGIIDDVVQIGIEDDAGMRQAWLEMEWDAVRTWAEHTYEEHRQQVVVLQQRQ